MRYFNIFTALLIAATLMSCEKESQDKGNVDTTVNIEGNYIRFDTGVSTRGALYLDDYVKDNFAVIGYNYRSTWEAAKAMAKPNVFDNTPQTVTYNSSDGGYYTYEPIKQWTGYNYAFYGYYPINDQITPINATSEGEPYIIYTLPGGSNPSSFIDVMTASYVDTNANSSKDVRLNFEHRLVAVDVGARCYYDYDPDPDNNRTDDIVQATVEIKQVWLTFANLENKEAKLYLNKDHTPRAEYTEANATEKERMIQLLSVDDNSIDIEPNGDGDTQMRIITNPTNKEYGNAEGQQKVYRGPAGTTMILIPQNTPLKVNPQMQYYLRLPNGKYIQQDKKSVGDSPYTFHFTQEFSFDRPLLEGRRYFIQFNFTSDAVSVNIVAADEWDEFEQIDYEFE